MTSTPDLLSTRQVAELFGVGPRAVASWAAQGRLPHIRTPGGHRRFLRTEIEALLVVHGTKNAPAAANGRGEDAEPSESVSHPTHRGASHAHPTT